MKQDVYKETPSTCPLCGELNFCGNISKIDSSERCWCKDPVIVFPQALTDMIPAAQKNKSCVCYKCVSEFDQRNT